VRQGLRGGIPIYRVFCSERLSAVPLSIAKRHEGCDSRNGARDDASPTDELIPRDDVRVLPLELIRLPPSGREESADLAIADRDHLAVLGWHRRRPLPIPLSSFRS